MDFGDKVMAFVTSAIVGTVLCIVGFFVLVAYDPYEELGERKCDVSEVEFHQKTTTIGIERRWVDTATFNCEYGGRFSLVAIQRPQPWNSLEVGQQFICTYSRTKILGTRNYHHCRIIEYNRSGESHD